MTRLPRISGLRRAPELVLTDASPSPAAMG
jgi:hypothetical protein